MKVESWHAVAPDPNAEFTPGRRKLIEQQRARFERELEALLGALGLPLDAESTRRTSARLLDALVDMTAGYEPDPKLVTTFQHCPHPGERGIHAQVVEGPIPFTALCEHHALPFLGRVWVAYVARGEVIGLSKLTRLVHQYARRFTMQERLGSQIAARLEGLVAARGTAVRIEAIHMCTRARGVRETEAATCTTTWRGVYENSADLRREFFELCRAN